VLPILWGERLIGRADMLVDRRDDKVPAKSLHAERDAPRGNEVSPKIGEIVEQLAEFLGAEGVVHAVRFPDAWKNSLH
jgi:uncharacterized protein YcaQ